jgi:hypothetical protein
MIMPATETPEFKLCIVTSRGVSMFNLATGEQLPAKYENFEDRGIVCSCEGRAEGNMHVLLIG